MKLVILIICIIYVVGMIITGNVLSYDPKERFGPLRGPLQVFLLAGAWLIMLPILCFRYRDNIFTKNKI